LDLWGPERFFSNDLDFGYVPIYHTSMQKVKRCTRCVMPETVQGISFNKDGICSFCQSYRKPEYLGKEALDKAVASSKHSNDRYDCIVPLSGGRDSTYVLHIAKAVYGLKTLAVHYDNEFKTDQALRNMETACNKLDVDFVTVRSRTDIVRTIVEYNIRSSVSRKLFRVCRACTYGFKSAAYRTAEEYKVPLILWGDSKPEEVGPMAVRASKNLKLRKSRPSTFLDPNYYKSKYYLLLQRLEFPVSGNSCLRKFPKLKNKDIKELHIFDYIPWSRREIKKTIMEQLGWEKPAGSVSTWRTDCKLTHIVNYCFFKMHGCSKVCFGYCKMINGGQMSREEALKQEEAMVDIIQDSRQMRKLLEDEIGLSTRAVDRILLA
jgi:tRNA(Ile)-lysidine synthase TilS/MesJ